MRAARGDGQRLARSVTRPWPSLGGSLLGSKTITLIVGPRQ
ncbi:MAG: hypothetical protein WKG07_49500 [Hymenobacter sp.]